MAAASPTPYADWLNQNPADANLMAQGFQTPSGPSTTQPPVTQVPAQPAPYSQQLTQLDAPSTTPQAPQPGPGAGAAGAMPDPPKGAGERKAGSSGLMKAANMVMAFYTGGLSAGLNAVAGQSQANSNAKGALSAVSKFSQKPDEPRGG